MAILLDLDDVKPLTHPCRNTLIHADRISVFRLRVLDIKRVVTRKVDVNVLFMLPVVVPSTELYGLRILATSLRSERQREQQWRGRSLAHANENEL